MNLDLARRFCLDYLPPEAQAPVNEIFNQMRETPTMILANGIVFTQMSYFKNPDKILAVAATNCFLTGFALAYCMQFPEMADMIRGYIDAASKQRGENVVNFLANKRS